MFLDEVFASRQTLTEYQGFESTSTLPKLEIHFDKICGEVLVIEEDDKMQCPFEAIQEDMRANDKFALPPPIFPARCIVITLEVIAVDRMHSISKLGYALKPRDTDTPYKE